MRQLLVASFLLCFAASLWCQVEPSATGGPVSLDDTQMMTPPPVSGDAYAVSVGPEAERSNYLRAGLVFTGAYTDNMYLGGTTGKVGDEQYSFQPTFYLSRRSTRMAESLNYSPGFTIYQNLSQLNGASQQGQADYQLHLAKYMTLDLRDSFYQNSNLYNSPNPFAPGSVSPSGQTTNIFPFQNQVSNSSSAGINYQYARNAMIGASGSFDLTRYQDQSASSVPLENQNVTGMSAFFSRRLSPAHYTGLVYQFSKLVTFPDRGYTDTHSVMGFFTVYLTRDFSLSILGGPQHYRTSTPTTEALMGWTPAIQGSVGWNGRRASIAGSYSRGVSTASGLLGAFRINAFQAGAGWQLARRWTLDFGGGYSEFGAVRENTAVSPNGIRTGTGSVAINHPITERLSGALGYAHFHQDQAVVGSPLSFPESNRLTYSISYQFSRPIGR